MVTREEASPQVTIAHRALDLFSPPHIFICTMHLFATLTLAQVP